LSQAWGKKKGRKFHKFSCSGERSVLVFALDGLPCFASRVDCSDVEPASDCERLSEAEADFFVLAGVDLVLVVITQIYPANRKSLSGVCRQLASVR